jgi:uncharacterized membrane protein YgcG
MMKKIVFTVIGLLLAVQAKAASPAVYDNAGFFSPDAVAQANQTIADIKKSTGKDVMVETYSSIPADMQATYNSADKNAFFEQWLVSRARVEHVNGVFVLICKNPSHLQVEAGKDTRTKAFTVADRDQLRNILVDHFKAKDFDQGLLDGVKYVQTTMQSNLGNNSAAQSTSSTPAAPQPVGPTYSQPSGPSGPVSSAPSSHHFGILPVIIVIGVIIFLARAFLRTRGNSYGYGQNYGGTNAPPIPPTNYGYGNQYPPQTGGGFGRGMLGGLLGGALGGYLYDKTSHHNSGSSNFPAGGGGGFPENTGSSPSSGGDFDSPSFDSGSQGAGGDFGGGGDMGGGGGGDSGGGGGSGGDF